MSALLLLLIPLAGLAFLFDSSFDPAAPDPEDGTELDDEMTGSDDADHLRGGAGGDVISGLGGADILEGGEGDDIVSGGGGSDTLLGGTGKDKLHGGEDDDTLHGGEAIDWLYGNEGNDTLHGGGGNDRLYGNEGNDVLFGGAGDDQLGGDAGGDDTLYGGQGNDSLYSDQGNDILHGGAGDDTLRSSNFDAELNGDAGNDALLGKGNMHGGAGEDELRGTGVLQGGADDDLVYGSGILRGGTGADVLILDDAYRDSSAEEGQINTMNGGDGGDLMFLTTEDLPEDHVVAYGGAGADTFVLEHDGAPQVPEIRDFDPDEDTLFINTPRTLSDPGDVRLVDWADGSGADLYLGDTLLAKVSGAAGLDPSAVELGVADYPGNRTLEGTDGDDTLVGDAGHDTLRGGDGDDRLVGYSGDDLLDGGAGDDKLSDSSGDDLLRGGDGNDVLTSRGGADVLEGGAGDDKLTASGQDSILDGGDGDDSLSGGNGVVMIGGAGADTFDILMRGPVSGPAEVTDFDPTEDVLELSARWNADDDGPFSSQVQVVDWDNGDGADIYLNGTLVAKVTGAAGLDPATIRLDLNHRGEVLSPVTGGDQDDFLGFWKGYDSVIDGGRGDDNIYGIGHLIGGEGNDKLIGGGRLEGGSGNDYVSGGSAIHYDGEYLADGGAGDDLVMASVGTLTGGAGADLMALTITSTTEVIEVTDFDPSVDQLVIRKVDWNPMLNGELSVVDWEDGTGADFYLGGVLLAKVHGAAGLSPYEVRVLDHDDYGYNFNTVFRTGTDGADSLTGSEWFDILSGGEGDDFLDGGINGDDVLMGGAGDDVIHGSSGSVLNGGLGDDTLTAELGATMTGGEGVDNFNTKIDIRYLKERPSVITDFDPTEETLTLEIDWHDSNPMPLRVVDWVDGTGADIFLGDYLVVKASGAAGLDPASVTVSMV